MRSSLLNGVCMFFCVFFHYYHPVSEAWLRRRTDCACEPRDGLSRRVMSRLLLVGLLLVSVPRSVLDVGRAGAEPIQVTTVLCIIDMILKEHLRGKEKNTGYWEQTSDHLISCY